ncbi:McrB family protein [Companilactobacillus zhongbaensis]|uniref:McrB family protein n=1 Tax=Companilactobacillus zhongbaensis TaxID=2486009 RepID=UPI000F76B2BF|nr:AAA family ATPase [Companilactobacillus zhongbaensis]
MRSDGMVILAGLSGTGKSQLVKCYGNALKLPHEQVKFVSVESNWTDDSDLMGFYDPTSNKYYPGKSGLVDKLLDAEQNPEKLYIIVFDEMNLSKVEQYFSQFLSVLEMDKGSREITLYDSGTKDNHYPNKIKIGDNVFFVGTINTDESTYKFSDKVLDRTNVIKLGMQEFTLFNTKHSEEPWEGSTISSYQYAQMGQSNQDKKLKDNELNLLWNLHKDINSVEPNVGIGWRVVNQIDNYMSNLPEQIGKFQGLDYQINQRVMTKISGSDQQLNELLGQSNIKDQGGTIYQSLGKYLKAEESNKKVEDVFKKTLETVDKKRKDLVIYGYTI